MGNYAILANGIGKRYRIGARREDSLNFGETIVRLVKSPLRRFKTLGGGDASETETIWALRDATFEVKQGDTLGIIGRNASGKSTLLKILARITDPTTGNARIYGRVGSLLEVGTGFHAELTGRENIFLNGAILGMSKSEIRRRFDEIVDFSGFGKFLDTPIKRYSSGMHVRLAFAVAAHLDTEILLVDEVLAVGDAEFQRKCMGKMGDVAKEGRTVLFVSHNMAAVKSLCNSAMLLSGGEVAATGPADSVVSEYLNRLSDTTRDRQSCLYEDEAKGVRLRSIDFLDGNGDPLPMLLAGDPASLRLSVETTRSWKNLEASIGVNSVIDDTRICIFESALTGDSLELTPPGGGIHCHVSKLPFPPGRYRLTVQLVAGEELLFYLPGIVDMDVAAGPFYPTGRLPNSRWGGFCMVDHSWKSMPPEWNVGAMRIVERD